MKKIAIVANSSWNIYNYRLALARFLKLKGYHIITIAPLDEYTPSLKKEFASSHITLHHLSPKSNNPFKDFTFLKELHRIYKKIQPDFILHYTIKPNIYGSLVARLLNIPCISTLTGLGYTFIHPNIFTRYLALLYKIALQKNKYVIFHNTDDYNLFLQKNLVPTNIAKVIKGSGVDTTLFSPTNNYSPTNKKFVFLFIGRLLYDKGIIEYAQAAQQLNEQFKNIECWIVGDFNTKNPSVITQHDFDKWIKNKAIKYFGKTDEIKTFIQESSVIVLPSYREGMPRAILEGMSMAKPIITTNTPGCRETVEENVNGFLVPPKNANALAKAMEKMIILNQTKNSLNIMGQASRIKVKKEFSQEIINQSYLELIAFIK